MPNLANPDYVERINRTIDHIQANLKQPMRLGELARLARFSPYHFHRIFKALVGETLNEFVQRVRLERAVYLMSHRDPASLTQVALACGFSSSSSFSRSFRKHYGVPPSRFDLEAFRGSKRERLEDTLPQAPPEPFVPTPSARDNPDGFAVRIHSRPPSRLAYIRVLRPFDGRKVQAAAERLVSWARDHGFEHGEWFGYMWDDPEIVDLNKCRYDVGVQVPTDCDERRGGVTFADFPQLTLAEIAIAGPLDLELRAFNWLYGTWLPGSGYVPDHQPAFEAWNGLPFAHGDSHFDLRIQLPVVRASKPL